MQIERSKYYSYDKYGNMLFNITRCYNDMSMARRLVNSISEGKYDSDSTKISYSLYLSKLYLGHLKEALKLLDVIYYNNDFNSYFCTNTIAKLLGDISAELRFEDSSLNKKYLGIRHDVFHYKTIETKDIKSFIKANEVLSEKGFKKVNIKIEGGNYDYELASDVLTLTKYFNCNQIPKEITELYNKVLIILKKILTNICNTKK